MAARSKRMRMFDGGLMQPGGQPLPRTLGTSSDVIFDFLKLRYEEDDDNLLYVILTTYGVGHLSSWW